MKKIGILNGEISSVVSKMGHKDLIAIGDCGLPIPDKTKRIDIALTKDIPRFMDTLKNVLLELQVEEVILAEEIEENNPKIFEEIKKTISKCEIYFYNS